MMAAQIDRMPANFLCRVSKGRLFNTLQHFLLSLLRQPDRFFNTHHRFFYSLLRQLDRQLPTEVQRVHQPIGTVQIIRTSLTDAVR